MLLKLDDRCFAVFGYVGTETPLPEICLAIGATCVGMGSLSSDRISSLFNFRKVAQNLFFTLRFLDLKLFKSDYLILSSARSLIFFKFSSV